MADFQNGSRLLQAQATSRYTSEIGYDDYKVVIPDYTCILFGFLISELHRNAASAFNYLVLL